MATVKKMGKVKQKRARVDHEKPVELGLPKRKVGRYVLLTTIAFLLFLKFFANIDQARIVSSLTDLKLPEFEIPTLLGVNKDLKEKASFASVIVEGELKYSDRKKLQQKLVQQLQSDFIRLNLKQIQEEIMKDSWYRSAALVRLWPSTLKVIIEEEQPIARWGKSGFINRYGEIVQIGNTEMLHHLPYLEGQDELAYDIAKSYLTTSQILADLQLYITKLSVSDDGDWQLEINHKFQIALGSRHFSSRVERFIYLYRKQLAPLVDELVRVDMRYQSGVAIAWKKQVLTEKLVSNDIASR